MLPRTRLHAGFILGLASAALGWSCSGSDDERTLRGDAGAAGQDAEGGASGDGGRAGSSAGAGRGDAGEPAESDAGSSSGGAAGTSQGGAAGADDLGGQGGCTAVMASGGEGGAEASGASRVLYSNDFEAPNQALSASCGNSLDPIGINTLYGTPSFLFQQVNTVEGVVVDDPAGLYRDPAGVAKSYAIGMLSSFEDDLLALTFDVPGKSFLNVGFDLSSIDVSGCGGPFGVAAPVMQVRLYDTPSGVFSFNAPGTLLAQGSVTGVASSDQWTFTWTYGVVSLDATSTTGDALTVVFDLEQSGYAAFDNLSIVAANRSGVVDSNNDGIPDDQQCLP